MPSDSFYILGTMIFYPSTDYLTWEVYNQASLQSQKLEICNLQNSYFITEGLDLYCLDFQNEKLNIVQANPSTLAVVSNITVSQTFSEVNFFQAYWDYFVINNDASIYYVIDTTGSILCNYSIPEATTKIRYNEGYLYYNLSTEPTIFFNISCSLGENVSNVSIASDFFEWELFVDSGSPIILGSIYDDSDNSYSFNYIENNQINSCEMNSVSSFVAINQTGFVIEESNNNVSFYNMLAYQYSKVFTIYQNLPLWMQIFNNILYYSIPSNSILGLDLDTFDILVVFTFEDFYLLGNGAAIIPTLGLYKFPDLSFWEYNEYIQYAIDTVQSFENLNVYMADYEQSAVYFFNGETAIQILDINLTDYSLAQMIAIQAIDTNNFNVLIKTIDNLFTCTIQGCNSIAFDYYFTWMYFVDIQLSVIAGYDSIDSSLYPLYSYSIYSSSGYLDSQVQMAFQGSILKLSDTLIAYLNPELLSIQISNALTQEINQTILISPELFLILEYTLATSTQTVAIPFFQNGQIQGIFIQGIFISSSGQSIMTDLIAQMNTSTFILWPNNTLVYRNYTNGYNYLFVTDWGDSSTTETYHSELAVVAFIIFSLLGIYFAWSYYHGYKTFRLDACLISDSNLKEKLAEPKIDSINFVQKMGRIEYFVFTFITFITLMAQMISSIITYDTNLIISKAESDANDYLVLDFSTYNSFNLTIIVCIVSPFVQAIIWISIFSKLLYRRQRLTICLLTLAIIQISISSLLSKNFQVFTNYPFLSGVYAFLYFFSHPILIFFLTVWSYRFSSVALNKSSYHAKMATLIETVNSNGSKFIFNQTGFEFCEKKSELLKSYRNISFVGSLAPTIANLIFANVKLSPTNCVEILNNQSSNLPSYVCLIAANYYDIPLTQTFYDFDGVLFGSFGLFLLILNTIFLSRTILVLHKYRAKMLGLNAKFRDKYFWAELIEDIFINFSMTYTVFFLLLDPDIVALFTTTPIFLLPPPNDVNVQGQIQFSLTVDSNTLFTSFSYALLMVSLYSFIYHAKSSSLLSFYKEKDFIKLAKIKALSLNYEIENPYNESLEFVRKVYGWFPKEKSVVKAQAILMYFDEIGILKEIKN